MATQNFQWIPVYRKKVLRLDERGASVFAAPCFAPRLDPLTVEVSSLWGESSPLRYSRVVSVLRRPYKVVDAEATVELKGCVSGAVLGHQLLSRMLRLFVQQKKKWFLFEFQVRELFSAKLTLRHFNCTLFSFSFYQSCYASLNSCCI